MRWLRRRREKPAEAPPEPVVDYEAIARLEAADRAARIREDQELGVKLDMWPEVVPIDADLEVLLWKLRDFGSHSARMWRNYGFDEDSALKWYQAGFTPWHAHECRGKYGSLEKVPEDQRQEFARYSLSYEQKDVGEALNE